jgi:hypothetical protein
MPRFEVQIVESRDLVFEVEADSEAEAADLANDMDASAAVRDSFRSREHDWTVQLGAGEKPAP